MNVALLAIAMIGRNASLWLRHRSLAAARDGWRDADFEGALAVAGCTPDVIAALRAVLADYYMAGLSPRPDDDLADVLRISPDEMEEVVERLFMALAQPEPAREAPERNPDLRTVEDLALYIQSRSAALRPS